jgi:hypothetical protein
MKIAPGDIKVKYEQIHTGYLCGFIQELYNEVCAQNEIRTRTTLRLPPPQDGASTNFATWALLNSTLIMVLNRYQKK